MIDVTYRRASSPSPRATRASGFRLAQPNAKMAARTTDKNAPRRISPADSLTRKQTRLARLAGTILAVAPGSSVENGSAFNSSHSPSGIGSRAQSSVSLTRSDLVTPQIVDATCGSGSENCSAAAPGGTP